MHLMKVTAIIPDTLLDKVTTLTKGQTTTEALIIALKEWVNSRELVLVSEKIRKHPLRFSGTDVARRVRKINRKQS